MKISIHCSGFTEYCKRYNKRFRAEHQPLYLNVKNKKLEISWLSKQRVLTLQCKFTGHTKIAQNGMVYKLHLTEL